MPDADPGDRTGQDRAGQDRAGHDRAGGPGRREVRMLNGRFDALTEDEVVDAIADRCRRGERGWVTTVNVAILMTMRRDPALQSFVDRSTLNVVDGQPIVWLGRVLRRPVPERVAGIDLVGRLCRRAEADGLRVFLLGGTREVIDVVGEQMRAAHPQLELAWDDGYFTADQAAERAAAVAAARPDILLVGMGVPRQEQFIDQQWDALGCTVAIGVGGSFDVISGLRRRAPVWMQERGLEWVYRLRQEPQRLFMRYLTTGARFLALSIRAGFVPQYRER